MKACKRCGKTKPLDEFANHKDHGRYYRRHICRACERERARANYARLRADPERWARRQQANSARYRSALADPKRRKAIKRRHRESERDRIARLRADPERWQQYLIYQRNRKRVERQRLTADPALLQQYRERRKVYQRERRKWLKRHRPAAYQRLLERQRLSNWEWRERNGLPQPKRRRGIQLVEVNHRYPIGPFRRWLKQRLAEHTRIREDSRQLAPFHELLGVEERQLYAWLHEQSSITLPVVDRALHNEGSTCLWELYDETAKPLKDSSAVQHDEHHDRACEQDDEDEKERLKKQAA